MKSFKLMGINKCCCCSNVYFFFIKTSGGCYIRPVKSKIEAYEVLRSMKRDQRFVMSKLEYIGWIKYVSDSTRLPDHDLAPAAVKLLMQEHDYNSAVEQANSQTAQLLLLAENIPPCAIV